MANSAIPTIGSDAKEIITQRLSLIDDLYFPRKVQPSAATDSSHRKSLLADLLSTDAAVFLERYGSRLSVEELSHFDVLRGDYEINWHLNHLRSIIDPTVEDKKSRSMKIKNRRLAYMDKLMVEGHYFSEDAMREREPYLHHEYVGKFQDPYGRGMARPGERWSETLMRRSEEAILVEKIRSEQQMLGEEEEEEEQEEEEEEDDEESETEVAMEKETNLEVHRDHNAQLSGVEGTDNLSTEEIEERLEQFTSVMQHKFLSGKDEQHLDYSKIDEDETLDDHWMKEANQDAEEKYFDDI
ncbi:hypothetical protein ABFX02_05G091600 [Erythranthe guttata]